MAEPEPTWLICKQNCLHSSKHERLWGKGIVSQHVDYCGPHHCLWWTRRDGHWREKVWCEVVEGEQDDETVE